MDNPVDPVGASLKAEILTGARHASTLSAPDRRVVVTHLIEQSVDAKLNVTEEIFRLAYGDRDGRSYWLGWLTEDFSDLNQFVRLLEIHNGKARDLLYISRSPILEAFSVASRAGPTWLRHVGGENRDLGRSNHPAHLAGWEVCRGPAVNWLLQHPEFRELLPKAILQFLDDDGPKSGGQGRPTSMGHIVQEIHRRNKEGAIPMKRSEWNRELSQWLVNSHPKMPRATPKAIGNSQVVTDALRELGLLKAPI